METEIEKPVEVIDSPKNTRSSGFLWRKEWGWDDKKQVTKDINAPEYYSKTAIYGFSVFFSTLAGVILLAINIKKSGSKKGIIPIVIFGVVYMALVTILGLKIHAPSGFAILAGGVGALLLNEYFWKKYIGQEQYRKRSIWAPLIICLLAFAVIVLLEIMSGAGGN